MRPVVLTILDGWGVAPLSEGNAIERARLPFFEHILQTYPSATLEASGEAVGLPYGEMGNSEVGHLTIGLGRVHYQPFPQITRSIMTKEFFKNPPLRGLFDTLRSTGGKLHVVGIISTGAVHGSLDHLFAVLDLAHSMDLHHVVVHAITDGRDTPYNSGINFVERLEQRLELFAQGSIATLSGRYWAMDRDTHWERTQEAFEAIVRGHSGHQSHSPLRAIQDYYNQGIYDEMIPPTVLTDGAGQPIATMEAGDGIVFTNFRPDRIRQLVAALTLPQFHEFDRQGYTPLQGASLTEYDKTFPASVAFPPDPTDQCLAQVVSSAGFRQLHVAETEKYAHVTYFINGNQEQPFPKEERILAPSPRVESYASAPAMSSSQIVERVLASWATSSMPELTIINFANADMVGHTGDFEATRSGVQVVDQCLERISQVVLANDAVLLITADHGNAEEMIERSTGNKKTYHTSNPVPFYLVGKAWEGQGTELSMNLKPSIGGLADIAPTVLELLGIACPPIMTGHSLLSEMTHT